MGAQSAAEDITAAEDDLAITGSGSGFLHNYVLMLDAKDGSKQWDFTLLNNIGGSMRVAATFDADSIYFGGQLDSHFYSLFRQGGATKWQKPGFVDLMDSQQAVVNGTVYIPDESVGVFALSSDTGELKWGAGYSGDGRGLPVAWRDGVVYGVRDRTDLVALDAETGAEKWTFSPVASFPWIIADSNQIIVRSDVNELTALNSADGSTLYTKTFDGQLFSPAPALAENRLFVPIVSAFDSVPDIVALSADDGAFLWSHEVDPGYVAELVVANGIVYFTGEDGVFALDAASGNMVWSASLPHNGKIGGLAVSDGTLFFGSHSFNTEKGEVYAFRNAQ